MPCARALSPLSHAEDFSGREQLNSCHSAQGGSSREGVVLAGVAPVGICRQGGQLRTATVQGQVVGSPWESLHHYTEPGVRPREAPGCRCRKALLLCAAEQDTMATCHSHLGEGTSWFPTCKAGGYSPPNAGEASRASYGTLGVHLGHVPSPCWAVPHGSSSFHMTSVYILIS